MIDFSIVFLLLIQFGYRFHFRQVKFQGAKSTGPKRVAEEVIIEVEDLAAQGKQQKLDDSAATAKSSVNQTTMGTFKKPQSNRNGFSQKSSLANLVKRKTTVTATATTTGIGSATATATSTSPKPTSAQTETTSNFVRPNTTLTATVTATATGMGAATVTATVIATATSTSETPINSNSATTETPSSTSPDAPKSNVTSTTNALSLLSGYDDLTDSDSNDSN